MLAIRLVMLIALRSTIAWCFISRPALTAARQSFLTNRDVCSSQSETAQYSATAANGEALDTRNIFHDYDKPVILLGASSEGNELQRLAASLVDNHFAPASSEATQPNIVSLVKKEQDLSNLRWSDIVVIDATDPAASEQMQMAETLYQDGYLSIYINVDPTASKMDESSTKTKNTMEEKFIAYSNYELCIKDEGLTSSGESDGSTVDPWEHIEWELARLIARARLIAPIPGDKTRTINSAHYTMGENTFFLSLSFPDITQVEPYIEEMCQDVDAMEYRTDLLDCRDSRFELLYGMQLLRRYSRPYVVRSPAIPFGGKVIEDIMPIVYTVRTQNQAGTYPDDDAGIAKMFELLKWGLRGGVEVLDVESAWDPVQTSELLEVAKERYSSQILGSHHIVGKEITTEDAVMLFEQCQLGGRSHGAKVVLSITTDDKDRMAYEAALITSELAAAEGRPVIPNISLILGDVGAFSRIINIPFTPVTHESLPVKAAPGQLTSNEIMATRLLTKIFTPKKYAILGHNIAYSVSPQMHGAAFAATKLPHEYVRVDVATVEEFIESDLFKSDDFGGTSVTIPHKQAIIPYLDEVSEAAKSIGSVNTVIAKDEYFEDGGFKRVLYGDNTDWRGIYNPLNRLLGGAINTKVDCALILGAGGTARAAAYVAAKLGLRIVYYNRTPSKADELAETFGGDVVATLEKESVDDDLSLGDYLNAISEVSVRVVISTLPASANFTLPDWLLDGDSRPVVFDVNYKPFNTSLLLQAEASSCPVVRGSEMLWEQGVGQFELWTGRSAPYSTMKSVVLSNCQQPSP